jgi:hypothetical protein
MLFDWSIRTGLIGGLVFFLLQYLVKAMPQWLLWAGLSACAALMLTGAFQQLSGSKIPLYLEFIFAIGIGIVTGSLVKATDFIPATPSSAQEKLMPKTAIAETSILSPPQERLLGLISEYQKKFAASKLVITRGNGRLHFDEGPTRGQDVSMVRDLFGSEGPRQSLRFDDLLESMPQEYLRLLPEARLDNPFVVRITEAGLRYLREPTQERASSQQGLSEQIRLQKASLQFKAFQSLVDGNRTSWRILIHNSGPAEARNLKVRLLRISPNPGPQARLGGFPYDVTRVSTQHLPNWAAIECTLNPGSDETFEPFKSWLSSEKKLLIVGLDARDINRLNDFALEIKEGNPFDLLYEVSAANSDPIKLGLRVSVKDGNVIAERIAS